MQTFSAALTSAFRRTWQDRSTYFARVLLPLFLLLGILYFGALLGLMEQEKGLANVGVSGIPNGHPLLLELEEQSDIQIINFYSNKEISALVLSDSLQLGVVASDDFERRIAEGKEGELQLYYHAQRIGSTKDKVAKIIEKYNSKILTERLDSLGISEQYVTPVLVSDENVYRWMDDLPKYLGAVLPFFLVLFSFLACIFSAFDLFDESHLATANITPTVSANWILSFFVGLFTAILTAAGLYIVVAFHPAIPILFKNLITSWFSLKNLSLILGAMLPLLLFFTVWLSVIRLAARTYKRALNFIQATKIFFIFAFALVFSPFLSLDSNLLYLPGTNVTLFSRSVIMGEWEMEKLGWIFLSLMLFSVVGMIFFLKSYKNVQIKE